MLRLAPRFDAFAIAAVLAFAVDASGAPGDAPPRRSATAQAKKKKPKRAPAPAARPAPVRPVVPIELNLAIERVTLDNGLRVVVNIDHTSPTVAVAVTYDVGSRDEEQGRSGFAHLFEHMMFQGSRNVDKGEHGTLVAAHGGVLNGTTNADRTNYYEVLPSNELALALWLEADRMRSLAVTPENFENQRKVVEEEFRMRYSNVPYRMSALRLDELVYQGYWPYEHSTIGSMADLDAAKFEWVQAFHAKYYGPNRAVVTIAGDVDKDAALALVHTYFDTIPKVNAPAFADAALPEQTSPRTAVVNDEHARSPAVLYGWAVPAHRSPEHYALELGGLVLAEGQSSRLHQTLVRQRALAQGVNAGLRLRRATDVFAIGARLAGGAKLADVEKAIDAELASLGTRPVTDAELAKAKRQLQASYVLHLETNLARASHLGEIETFFGDASIVNGELPKYLAVTKEDIVRAVGKYLVPTRRTVVETIPLAPAAAAAPAAKKAN